MNAFAYDGKYGEDGCAMQKEIKVAVSKCCAAPMRVAGDGDGSHWYVCEKCGKDTDAVSATVKENLTVQKWLSMSDDALRLRCGEMTAQESRTVRAVLTAIKSEEHAHVSAPATTPLGMLVWCSLRETCRAKGVCDHADQHPSDEDCEKVCTEDSDGKCVPIHMAQRPLTIEEAHKAAGNSKLVFGEGKTDGCECGKCRWFEQECNETCLDPTHVACLIFDAKDTPTLDDATLSQDNKSEQWFCLGCSRNVPPIEVTYSEYHDERYGGCGCKCVVANQRRDKGLDDATLEAVDVIKDLLEIIHRVDTSCEEMHHEKAEYHKRNESCKVEAFVNRTMERAATLRAAVEKAKEEK